MASFVIEIPDWHPARTNQLYEKAFGAVTTYRFAGGRLVPRTFRPPRKKKNLDAQIVAHYAKLAEIQPATYKRRVHLHLVFANGSRARMGDVDAYWKSLLDALQKCKAIRNDNDTWCQIMPVTHAREDKAKSVIGLEDLVDGTPITCLTKGCRNVSLNRGLCNGCYRKFREDLRDGRTTEAWELSQGNVRPVAVRIESFLR